MTKLKRIIASFLVLSQIGSVCAFATETQNPEASGPSYTVSIPESVDFGTLNHEQENRVTYGVSVSYPGADTPNITVTSDTTGTLSQGADCLIFTNHLTVSNLTSQAPSATGTLTIDPSQVAQAAEGDYKGTLQFDVAVTEDDTTTGGGGSTTTPDDTYFLSDGYYYVDLWLWHQYTDQVSMGDVAFQNNRQALVRVSKGKVTTVEIATSPVNVSGILSAVQYFEVEGKDIGYLERDLYTTNTNNLTFYYIKRAEFTMPTKGQPSSKNDETFLDVRLSVPDTPMDMVIDDDGCMGARLKFDWSTVKATNDKGVSQNNTTSNSTVTEDTAEEETSASTTLSTTITTTAKADRDGNLVAAVSHVAVSNALADLNAMADEEDGDVVKEVKLEITAEGDVSAVATTVPLETMEMLREKTDVVTLETPIATLSLDGGVMETITSTATQDVEIKASIVEIPEHTPQNLVDMIGENPVYSFEIFSGEEKITQFGGAITVTVPYTLQEGENPLRLTVYYLAEDGSVLEMGATYHKTSETMSFQTTHFSSFVVAYDGTKSLFGDVSQDAWYLEAVNYVTDAGLFNGTSETAFAPEANMTRAMVMTVLARLAGVDTTTGDTWYQAGMEWAMEMGISDGTNPYGNVTREQLATMLHRHSGEHPVEADLNHFHDVHHISHWALDAKGWAVVNGIIHGKTDTLLAPEANATRAEVATMIMRFATSME